MRDEGFEKSLGDKLIRRNPLSLNSYRVIFAPLCLGVSFIE
jgi:hypothetical protein